MFNEEKKIGREVVERRFDPAAQDMKSIRGGRRDAVSALGRFLLRVTHFAVLCFFRQKEDGRRIACRIQGEFLRQDNSNFGEAERRAPGGIVARYDDDNINDDAPAPPKPIANAPAESPVDAHQGTSRSAGSCPSRFVRV